MFALGDWLVFSFEIFTQLRPGSFRNFKNSVIYKIHMYRISFRGSCFPTAVLQSFFTPLQNGKKHLAGLGLSYKTSPKSLFVIKMGKKLSSALGAGPKIYIYQNRFLTNFGKKVIFEHNNWLISSSSHGLYCHYHFCSYDCAEYGKNGSSSKGSKFLTKSVKANLLKL